MKTKTVSKIAILFFILSYGNLTAQYQARVTPQASSPSIFDRVSDLHLDAGNNLLANVLLNADPYGNPSSMLQFQRNNINTNINYQRVYSANSHDYIDLYLKKFNEYDGSFYVAGTVWDNAIHTTGKRLVFLKIDKSTGNVIFGKLIDVQGIDEFIDMTSDNNGNFYLLGNMFDGGSSVQYLIVKMRADGTLLFFKEYGDPNASDYSSSIYYSNSEIFVAGMLASQTINYDQFFAATLNSSGTLLNARNFSITTSNGNERFAFVDIQKPNPANIYLVVQARAGQDNPGNHFILRGPSLTSTLIMNAYESNNITAINSVCYNDKYILLSAEASMFNAMTGYASVLYNINGSFNNATLFNSTVGTGASLMGGRARSLLTGTGQSGILYGVEGDNNTSPLGNLFEISTDGGNSASCLETYYINPAITATFTNDEQASENKILNAPTEPIEIFMTTETPKFSTICTCIPFACRHGNEEFNSNEFFIYKSAEGISIRLNSDVPVEADVYNSLGEKIHSGRVEASGENGEYKIGLQAAKTGIYFITVKTETGNVLNGKIFMY